MTYYNSSLVDAWQFVEKKYQEGEVVAMMNHYYRRVIGVADHSSDCNDKVTKALQ
jgi:hypothetical protein